MISLLLRIVPWHTVPLFEVFGNAFVGDIIQNDEDTVKVGNEDVLETVSKLLQLEQKDFGRALLSRTVAARGEVMDKLLRHNEVRE